MLLIATVWVRVIRQHYWWSWTFSRDCIIPFRSDRDGLGIRSLNLGTNKKWSPVFFLSHSHRWCQNTVCHACSVSRGHKERYCIACYQKRNGQSTWPLLSSSYPMLSSLIASSVTCLHPGYEWIWDIRSRRKKSKGTLEVIKENYLSLFGLKLTLNKKHRSGVEHPLFLKWCNAITCLF